jgi:hypothetical protein
MLNLISKITITQQANPDFPSRSKIFTFDFVTEGEVYSSWQNLTDTARLVFPKNIYFKDESGNNYSWQGKNIIEGNNTPPIIMRGDKVKIEWGYYYNVDSDYHYQTESNTIFEGYISRIFNRMPIEIECEDNMWKLKQVAAPSKLFRASQYNLQTMLTELTSKTGFTINSDATTNVGDIRTGGETVAQVLDRLQRDYRLESYFRGDELRCSGIVYYPDYTEKVFQFQQNIIGDQLEYRRLDDIKIGVKAYSVNEFEISGKKKKKRLSVFVTKDVKSTEEGFDGEKRTLYFWNVTSENDLAKKAQDRLNRLYYEGFFGSFESFGFPFVKHGDHAIIRDNILPERNGTYKIKAVTYRFGMGGYRQDIEIDIRVDGLSKSELDQGL